MLSSPSSRRRGTPWNDIMSRIVVIAGPSGSGKNTIINAITKAHPHVKRLVTATTRLPRDGEEDGKDYHFFSLERFDRELLAGHIIGERYVPLFGGVRYGIYMPDLQHLFAHAGTILAPVDIAGYRALKERYAEKVIGVFIMPESLQEFRARIKARSHMPETEFEARMKITEDEVRLHAPEYDYRVVNADGMIKETTAQVVEIMHKEGYTL